MKIIVIERFFIFFSKFILLKIVERLFLNEKKHKDKIILYNSGIVNLAINAQKQIVKSNLSIPDIFIFVFYLQI